MWLIIYMNERLSTNPGNDAHLENHGFEDQDAQKHVEAIEADHPKIVKYVGALSAELVSLQKKISEEAGVDRKAALGEQANVLKEEINKYLAVRNELRRELDALSTEGNYANDFINSARERFGINAREEEPANNIGREVVDESLEEKGEDGAESAPTQPAAALPQGQGDPERS